MHICPFLWRLPNPMYMVPSMPRADPSQIKSKYFLSPQIFKQFNLYKFWNQWQFDKIFMWCHSIKACFNCHSNLSFDERSIAAHVPRDLPLYYGTDDGHLRAVLVSFCRYRARGLTEVLVFNVLPYRLQSLRGSCWPANRLYSIIRLLD